MGKRISYEMISHKRQLLKCLQNMSDRIDELHEKVKTVKPQPEKSLKKIIAGTVAFMMVFFGIAVNSDAGKTERQKVRFTNEVRFDNKPTHFKGLHVASGISLFAEAVTFSAGIVSTTDITANGNITGDGATVVSGVLETTETVTATNAITASECGKIFFLNSATEFASTLPAISTVTAGTTFKFIVVGAPSGASYTVITGNSLENVIYGGTNEAEVDTGDDAPYVSAGDTVTFVDGSAVQGDWVAFISDGTSYYVSGQANVDGGITLTQAD